MSNILKKDAYKNSTRYQIHFPTSFAPVGVDSAYIFGNYLDDNDIKRKKFLIESIEMNYDNSSIPVGTDYEIRMCYCKTFTLSVEVARGVSSNAQSVFNNHQSALTYRALVGPPNNVIDEYFDRAKGRTFEGVEKLSIKPFVYEAIKTGATLGPFPEIYTFGIFVVSGVFVADVIVNYYEFLD